MIGSVTDDGIEGLRTTAILLVVLGAGGDAGQLFGFEPDPDYPTYPFIRKPATQ
jgi:hypothetical protein